MNNTEERQKKLSAAYRTIVTAAHPNKCNLCAAILWAMCVRYATSKPIAVVNDQKHWATLRDVSSIQPTKNWGKKTHLSH